MTEFDSPWKEALDRFFPAFVEFFFPSIAAAVAWEQGYEVLDKELEQIVREGELGLRLADKLFKVWRKDGQEAWVLIHVEVQSQPDPDFPERMYVYNYRIFDRFRKPVVSLAVLGDERPNWRPGQFRLELWGCRVTLDFPVVKLLDYAGDPTRLEESPNPFGIIVLAHLQSQATREDAQARCTWKIRLVKGLLDRGLSAEQIRQLFRFIDWLLELPRELDEQFEQALHTYQQEKQMPFMGSLERLWLERGLEQGRQEGRQEGREEGREKGRQEGREEGKRAGLLEGIALALEIKFGAEARTLLPALQALTELDALRAFEQAIRTANSVTELRQQLPTTETDNPSASNGG
jgi:hypothetical protein